MIKALLISARPKTLMVGIAPVLLGSALAYSSNSTNFSLVLFSLIFLCTVLLQMGTNLVNEYFDYLTGIDSENRQGPKRSIQLGLVGPKEIKFFYLSCFLISFILGLKLMSIGGMPIISIGLISILVAYAYTGGPIPLSHYCLGELLAFVFFGPVAVLGTVYLFNLDVNFSHVIFSLIPGFISAGLMSLNNLRDISTDKLTTKKTIAILLGEKKARFLTLLLGIFPGIISIGIIIQTKKPLFFIFLLPPLLFIPLWKKILSEKSTMALNLGIAAFGKYNLLYCVLIAITLNFI